MRVLTIGTFDILHFGHINLLQKCAELGELMVGVNSDEFVASYKGVTPIMTLEERRVAIEQLGYVTQPNNEAGQELIRLIRPDILVVGSDWARKDYLKQIDVTQDWLDNAGISLIYIPYTKTISTTEIKRRCKLSS
jgi:cytidyltransferase-like protein